LIEELLGQRKKLDVRVGDAIVPWMVRWTRSELAEGVVLGEDEVEELDIGHRASYLEVGLFSW
jgi:hypothetical protein